MTINWFRAVLYRLALLLIACTLLGLLTAQQGQQKNPAPPKRSEGHVPLFDAFDQALWLW